MGTNEVERTMTRPQRFHANRLIALATGLLLSALWSCGIKGPPVPPQQAPVPAVVDLIYQLTDRSVALSWRLSMPLDGKSASQAAFVIYRSRTALDEPACETCPLVFEKAGMLPYVDTENDRFAFNVPIDSGYRYVFKVHLKLDGIDGPDSNPVQFKHVSDGHS